MPSATATGSVRTVDTKLPLSPEELQKSMPTGAPPIIFPSGRSISMPIRCCASH